MKFAEKAELAKGISNVVIGAGCVPATAIVARTEGKRSDIKKSWTIEFVLLTLAAFGGALVHSFAWNDKQRGRLWAVLYAIEFELVRRLYMVMAAVEEGYKLSKLEHGILLGAEIVFYLTATIIRLVTGRNTYSFFLVYAGIVGVMLGKLIATEEKNESTRSFLLSICSLVTAMLCQIIDKKHGAVIAHIFILLALVPLTDAAKKSIK